jgi:hypothetical protein
VRVGDSWTKIDYSKQPTEWMVPLRRGRETDLIEIPASWYLDDVPPMLFIKALDRRRRPTRRFHPQHRCGGAPPREDETRGGGKPRSQPLSNEPCRLAGQRVRPVDRNR